MMSAEMCNWTRGQLSDARKSLTSKDLREMPLEQLVKYMPYADICFADEYLISLNKSQAYRIAKGNPTITSQSAAQKGSDKYKDIFIRAYIEKRLAEKDEERISRQDEVLEFLSDVMRNNHEKLGYSKDLYIKDRIQAAELLGKRYALFTEKIQGHLQAGPLQIEIIDAVSVSDVDEN